MTFDPATIAAFVDGELDDLTARRIEREAETDDVLAAAIAREQALKAQLRAHYAPIAQEPVPERLRSLLTADDKVDASLADRRDAKRAPFSAIHWCAIAASLVLGLTVGLRPWVPAADVATKGGALVAAGSLADALDTQLASNQPRDAAVRIGLSFEDKADRYCRSFAAPPMEGIGCREGNHWRIERTFREAEWNEYRQASSGELGGAVAQMMEGTALDAESEREARDAGWTRRP